MVILLVSQTFPFHCTYIHLPNFMCHHLSLPSRLRAWCYFPTTHLFCIFHLPSQLNNSHHFKPSLWHYFLEYFFFYHLPLFPTNWSCCKSFSRVYVYHSTRVRVIQLAYLFSITFSTFYNINHLPLHPIEVESFLFLITNISCLVITSFPINALLFHRCLSN